jgi:potassium efflux system protein
MYCSLDAWINRVMTRCFFALLVVELVLLSGPPDRRPLRAQSTAPSDTPARITNPLRRVKLPAMPLAAEPSSLPVEPSSAPAPLNEASTPASSSSLTLERVADLTRQVREATGIPDEMKQQLLQRYQSATELLQSIEDARRRTTQYEREVQQGAQAIEAARSELAKSPDDPSVHVYEEATIAELETLLSQFESRLSDARGRLNGREAELKNRAERRSELAKKIDEVKQRLTETEQELSLAAPQGEALETTTARQTEMEARQQSLQATLDLYQAEIKRLDKLGDLFPLTRDIAKRETNLLEREVAHIQARVAAARKLESERQAREARRQAELADPALRDLAEHNAALAETRKKISEKVTLVSAEVKDIEQQLGRLNHEFEGAKSKVEKAGHSTTVGLLLRRQRDGLPSVAHCQQRLRFIQQEMPVVNLQRMELEEDRTTLGDIEAAQQQVLRNLNEQLSRVLGDQLPTTVRELLSAKRDLLDKLISDLDAYLFALGELESNHHDLIEESEEFRGFINEHVLWIRSAEPLGSATLPQISRGLLAIVHPQPWLRLAANSGLDTLREPWMAAGVFAAVLLLLVLQARLRRQIRTICECRANSLGVKFFPSVLALLLTAAVTAGWPLLIGYLGWRMTSFNQVSPLGLAVGPALMHSAGILWLSEFVRWLCRVEGVAETFFQWPRSGLKVARGAVRWLTLLGVPLTGVVIVAQLYNQGEWADSIGRVAFVVWMLLLAAFAQSVLGRRNNVFREPIAKDPQGWLSRIRAVAHLAGILLPLSLSVLAIVGYYYSAQQLAVRLQGTLALGMVALLVHAVVSRWFVVKRRRLALEQARERKQFAQDEPVDGSAGIVPAPVVNDAPDWAAVHERLRLLLRQAITVSLLVACWFIWSAVLPALKILDNVELWSKTTEVTERFEDADGNVQHVKNLELVRTTLRHGVIAAMILLATFVLGRNLPALLEITVLNRLPLDRGGRHAISILLHYSVALSGVVVALRTLSINWASVQWLAAGITVGLGFGLQEIFANFVSGMILLFERPIRVGDIVTLDDVTGTVTNIRMRATTVTNWDRKELIVPNKNLITGRLLNWTLSDTTNRIVINVGLSYQSDANRARQVLEQTVLNHPNVLREPSPAVTLESFGDSTLGFVIRAYLSSLDVRLATVHELHVAIHQRLQKEGIEFAFPQRDINIRNLDWVARQHMPGTNLPAHRSEAA